MRRALELATGEGIALYRDIVTAFAKLPELDGQAAHKLAERLGGFGGDSERLDLFLSLLLGLMERLIRTAANGEGAIGEEERLLAACSIARACRNGSTRGKRSARPKPMPPASTSIAACSCSRLFTDCSRRRVEARLRQGGACRGARPRLCHHRHGQALLHHHRHLLSQRCAPYRPRL